MVLAHLSIDRYLITRNRKHRQAAAKSAACAKPLMLSTVGERKRRKEGEVGNEVGRDEGREGGRRDGGRKGEKGRGERNGGR